MRQLKPAVARGWSRRNNPDSPVSKTHGRWPVRCLGVGSAVLAFILAVDLNGQVQPPRGQSDGATFEVASVKPSRPGSPRGGFGVLPGGRFVAEGVTLAELVTAA